MIMLKRKLKGSNKSVSAIGLGCLGIGGPFKRSDGSYIGYGQVDDNESIRMIHRAIELGINIFDTADIYGVGRSEKVLGKALEEYRDDVVIATKFASVFEEGNPNTPDKKNTRPEYIRSAIQASLRRLKTDFIDIYQLHSSEHDPEDALKVRFVLDDLVQEGLIGGYGWSTDDPERAKIYAESKNCNSIQYAIHIARANPRMVDLCEKNNLLGLIRSPLASGILTGKYNKDSKIAKDHMIYGWMDFFTSEQFLKRQEKLEEVKTLLVEDGRSLIQGLLSYLWSTSETTIPIPGAKTVKQIEENAAILELGPLKPNMIKKIDRLFEEIRVVV